MPITWKLEHPIDVIEAALNHHLNRLRREGKKAFFLDFQEENSDSVVSVYDLNYYSSGSSYTTGDNLGRIKLRKLNTSKTEILISDPYWSLEGATKQSLNSFFKSIDYSYRGDDSDFEKMISERQSLREVILEEIKKGFEEDGLLETTPKDSETQHPSFDFFVHQSRMKELRSIKNANFDLSKLIRLCEEINQNSTSGNYFSIAMLLRAILDHIPPIFGQKTFEQVVAQYGEKPFKEHMSHLDKSLRKIADSYLHIPIRKKEALPNQNQVNFSADLDVLLAEIARMLK